MRGVEGLLGWENFWFWIKGVVSCVLADDCVYGWEGTCGVCVRRCIMR